VEDDSQTNCSCGVQAAIFTKILSQDREKVFHQDGGAKPFLCRRRRASLPPLTLSRSRRRAQYPGPPPFKYRRRRASLLPPTLSRRRRRAQTPSKIFPPFPFLVFSLSDLCCFGGGLARPQSVRARMCAHMILLACSTEIQSVWSVLSTVPHVSKVLRMIADIGSYSRRFRPT
jgi:hypothetical protein